MTVSEVEGCIKNKIKELGFNVKELKETTPRSIVTTLVSKVRRILEKTFENRDDLIILWDVDTDGVFAGYIATNSLTEIKEDYYKYDKSNETHNQTKIHNYINETKIHGITRKFIRHCIKNNIKTVVIVDAGTNDIIEIQELNNLGISVIVIDHHTKTTEYQNELFVLINSTEMEYATAVSGAYLTNEIMERLYELQFKRHLTEYRELAAISLVADVCERDTYNKTVLLSFIYGRYGKTELINAFRDQYSENSIQFIRTISSTMNAIIRYHGTRRLMYLMLNDLGELKRLSTNKKAIKENNDMIIKDIITNSPTYDLGNLTVTVVKNKDHGEGVYLRNYLGIAAHTLGKHTGKLSIMMAGKEINFEDESSELPYCFSVRDPNKEDSLFKSIEVGIDSNGHSNAWGGNLGEDYPEKLKQLGCQLRGKRDLNNSEINKVIMIENLTQLIEKQQDTLQLLSLWNVIQEEEEKISFNIELKGTITKKGSIRNITHDGTKMISFDGDISIGERVIVTPEYNNKISWVVKKLPTIIN